MGVTVKADKERYAARDTAKVAEACKGQHALLHLACISNDASFELDERLSTSVNLESFRSEEHTSELQSH